MLDANNRLVRIAAIQAAFDLAYANHVKRVEKEVDPVLSCFLLDSALMAIECIAFGMNELPTLAKVRLVRSNLSKVVMSLQKELASSVLEA